MKCDWCTFYQLWPSTQAEAKQGGKPPAKPAGKAKAIAKGKDKDGKTVAVAANAAGGGDYGSTKTWQPKNTFEEAAGDVEEE